VKPTVLNTGPERLSRSIKKTSPIIITLTLLVLLWGILSYGLNIREIFLPQPHQALIALVAMFGTTSLWKDIWASWFRVLIAFFLSFAISYPLVLLALINDKIKESLFFVVEFFRYLPIPVFIPLTILWFGVGDWGKIMIVFLGTFAQMIPMYYDSSLLLEKSYQAFPFALKWNRSDYVKNITIPGSAPFILDNSRICFGWAWTYLIIAELLGAENGIGYAIIRAQRVLATDRIFAYILLIGLLGIISDRILVAIRKNAFKWA